ncbi:thioesterase domain-containing protein [Streptomyces sp. M19]
MRADRAPRRPRAAPYGCGRDPPTCRRCSSSRPSAGRRVLPRAGAATARRRRGVRRAGPGTRRGHRPGERPAGAHLPSGGGRPPARPNGPYRLAGWSFGGVLAFGVARELAADGAAVEPRC